MAIKEGKAGKKAVVNLAKKEREKGRPYASWIDPRNGWKFSLIASRTPYNHGLFARWFMWVEGYESEYGDTYVHELLSGLHRAVDLTFDTTIWADRDTFLAWARGDGVE